MYLDWFDKVSTDGKCFEKKEIEKELKIKNDRKWLLKILEDENEEF